MRTSGATASKKTTMPWPLWIVIAGMVVAVVLLIALPVAMAVDRSHTEQMILNDQPELDPAHLGFAFAAVMVFAIVLHGIDAALTLWFGIKAIQGRRWARIALTIVLVVLTVGSLFSAAAVPTYLWAVIPGDTAHILMVIALWVPKSVRDYFARQSDRSPAS